MGGCTDPVPAVDNAGAKVGNGASFIAINAAVETIAPLALVLAVEG